MHQDIVLNAGDTLNISVAAPSAVVEEIKDVVVENTDGSSGTFLPEPSADAPVA